MAADSTNNLSFDISVLDTLACPACLGELRMEEARLVCASCARSYPIVDGIPVLIPERSVGRSQTVSRAASSVSFPTLRTE
jgi:uncharacterized protein YbaR (Trm112 family)